MSFELRLKGFLIFWRQHLVPMLLVLFIFNIMFFFISSYFDERNDDRRQAEELSALKEAVRDIKDNQDTNSKNTNKLIDKADDNGRALDCILQFLGTGDAIQRSDVEVCRTRNRDGSTFFPNEGESVGGQGGNGQNQQGGVQSGQNPTPTPPPPWINILNGTVQVQGNPLNDVLK